MILSAEFLIEFFFGKKYIISYITRSVKSLKISGTFESINPEFSLFGTSQLFMYHYPACYESDKC